MIDNTTFIAMGEAGAAGALGAVNPVTASEWREIPESDAADAEYQRDYAIDGKPAVGMVARYDFFVEDEGKRHRVKLFVAIFQDEVGYSYKLDTYHSLAAAKRRCDKYAHSRQRQAWRRYGMS